jgi:hypothetical protein
MQREKLAKIVPDLLFADGYDDCILGITVRDDEAVVLYSTEKIVNKLSEEMELEEAYEYFDFNIKGSYVGKKTPVFYEEFAYDAETEIGS